MSVGDVFISYAHEDSGYKESLVLYLWEHGIAVWADELIVRGEEFPDQLEDQIRRAGAFVVLMSVPSSASAWVQREIRCAFGAGVPVFPLLRAGAPFPTIEGDYRYDDVRDGNLPSEDWVEDLRDALRPQGSARLAGPLGGVPRPDRVVGRGAAVRDLVAGIREDDGGGNVIDVVGFAGVGKTALARVAAEVVRPLFPCVAWVNANERAEPDPLSTLGPDRCLVVVDDVGRRRPDGVPPDDGALDRLRSAPGPRIVICIGRSPGVQRRSRNRVVSRRNDDDKRRPLPQIGAPATRALAARGITRLADLTHHRSDDLLALHGVGPKAVRLLRAALAEQGMSFADRS